MKILDMQAFISSRELSSGRANSRHVNFNCMFCSAEVLSDSAYREHLDTAHRGWAELIVARLALNTPRVNG
jgi:hypothetical protein